MAETATQPRISEERRMYWLQVAMRLFGAGFVVSTAFVGLALVLDLGIVGEGTFLEWFFFWHPRNVSYELMLIAMLGAWGIFLWRAARDPQEHRFFIDFSLLFLGLHALVMAYTALVVEGEVHHLITDVFLLAVAAGVLLALRPTGGRK